VELYCSVDLSIPRNQECLKLFQSFACTLGCPEYGVPAQFDNICYEDVQRLWDVCDGRSVYYGSFYNCLEQLGYFPYDYAEAGVEDCYHVNAQNLIPASDKFAHDYCLFGDPARCYSAEDCQLTVNPNYGFLGDHCECCVDPGYLFYYPQWQNDTAYLTKVHGENTTAPNGGHICIIPSNGFVPFFTLTTLTIVRPQLSGGFSCEDVAAAKLASTLGLVDQWDVQCDYDNKWCEVVGWSIPYFVPGGIPDWCNGNEDLVGWTDEAKCWYDLVQYD